MLFWIFNIIKHVKISRKLYEKFFQHYIPLFYYLFYEYMKI